MPVHDWTRVDAGLCHHIDQDRSLELCRTLNVGRLPEGFVALTDQQTGAPIADVLTLSRGPKSAPQTKQGNGVAFSTAPP